MSQTLPAIDSTALDTLLKTNKVHFNLHSGPLVEHSIRRGEAQIADNGALSAITGKFTGRTPKDRFTVKDSITADKVAWGEINQPLDPEKFDAIFERVLEYLRGKELFVRTSIAAPIRGIECPSG